MRKTPLALALVGVALSGCNLVFGLDEGVYDPGFAGGAGGGTSSSSTGSGGADWSCVGKVKAKTDVAPYAYQLTEAKLDSLLGETPTAKLCQAADPACVTSVPLSVMSNGALTITASEPYFGGYAPIASTKYRPYVVELGPAVDLPDPIRRFQMYTPPEVTGAFFLLGVKEEAGHGVAAVFVRDCAGLPAAGVRVESSTTAPTTQLIYQDKDGNFQKGFQQTDEAGAALYGNVPVGESREIVLRRASDLVVVARANVRIRDKTLTVLHLRPTP